MARRRRPPLGPREGRHGSVRRRAQWFCSHALPSVSLEARRHPVRQVSPSLWSCRARRTESLHTLGSARSARVLGPTGPSKGRQHRAGGEPQTRPGGRLAGRAPGRPRRFPFSSPTPWVTHPFPSLRPSPWRVRAGAQVCTGSSCSRAPTHGASCRSLPYSSPLP